MQTIWATNLVCIWWHVTTTCMFSDALLHFIVYKISIDLFLFSEKDFRRCAYFLFSLLLVLVLVLWRCGVVVITIVVIVYLVDHFHHFGRQCARVTEAPLCRKSTRHFEPFTCETYPNDWFTPRSLPIGPKNALIRNRSTRTRKSSH